MKKACLLLLGLVFWSCDSEKSPDCLQTTGDLVVKEIQLPPFEKILLFDRVKLYITHGEKQKVIVKTGKNLLPEVTFSVDEKKLSIKNENSCNLLRDYKTVKVYVTSPNLTHLKNGSQWVVESTNVLKYPTLTLRTEISANSETSHTDSGFNLQLACEELHIVNNGMASYFLSGKVKNMFVGFYSNDGRLEASDLLVQNLRFYHRSSNLFLVNPQKSLRGEIRSTGDMISLNKPAIVEVKEFYTGKLIFETE